MSIAKGLGAQAALHLIGCRCLDLLDELPFPRDSPAVLLARPHSARLLRGLGDAVCGLPTVIAACQPAAPGAAGLSFPKLVKLVAFMEVCATRPLPQML